LGISIHRERSRWLERAPGFFIDSELLPLARDLSAGERLERGDCHPSGRLFGAAQAVLAACSELRLGATLGVVSGVRSIRRLCSTIVLIAEVGTRRVVFASPGE
jgi:hypothetical protein